MGCQAEEGHDSMPPHAIAEVIAAHAESLMAVPGVVGVYEGVGHDGKPVLRVMLAKKSAEARRRLPKRLEGYRVELEVTGPIRPM